MKKTLSIGLVLLAFSVMLASPAMSTNCASHAAKTGCTPEQAAACAAKCGMSPEECQQYCQSKDHKMINMSIKGMTCGGCENSVTKCLEAVPGVVKVGKVDHKTGTAFLVMKADKANTETLVKAVTKKGFKAEVMPAVHTVDASQTDAASKACGVGKSKKACAPGCAATCRGKGAAKTTKAKDALEGSK